MKSIRQMARENGMTNSCIRARIKKGWTLEEALKPKGWKRSIDVAERVKRCDAMLEYLGGYENKKSIIKLKCLRCGNEFERVYERLLTKKFESKCGCPECAERDGRARQHHKGKIIEAEKAKERMKAIGFELLEYTGADNKIKVKCLECGETFEHNSFHNFMSINKSKRYCPAEHKQKQNDAQIGKRLAEQAKRLKDQQEAKQWPFEKLKQRLTRNKVVKCVCANCGEEFFGHEGMKYCSKRCRQRQNERERAILKDQRIKSRKRDKGITLDKVFKRSNGICYLCGCKCDYDDYIIRDGTFIAGNKYPSIEHIKPIAKGGTDTWNNVALACRLCNSHKADKSIHQLTLPV